MKTKNCEDIVYNAVISGELTIDQQGCIWRIASKRGDRWNSATTHVPVARRRAEHRLTTGYLQIRSMTNYTRTNALAHRLVFLHFFGPLPPNLEINHKNGVKDDNRPDNLELVTRSQQQKHAIHVLGKGHTLNQHGEKNSMAKLTDAQVAEIRARRGAGERLISIASDFGIAFQTVSKIAKGHRR